MSDDFDDLDDLKRAMDAAAPRPDPARKAEAIALAMKNFDRAQSSFQETAEDARPTSDRPAGGLLRGVKTMLNSWTSRGVLTASTALAAVALLAVLPVMQQNAPGAPDFVQVEQSGGFGGLMDMMSADEVAPAAAPAPRVDSPVVPNERLQNHGLAQTYSGSANTLSSEDRKALQNRGLIAGGNIAMEVQESYVPGYDAPRVLPEADTEAYPQAEANPLKVTAEDPVSTFSIDVDTASWSMIRNSLMRGALPPKGAVRIEEMVNYFSYDYAAPAEEEAFRASVGVMQTPWNAGTQLVHIGLQGALPAERPAMNLVFLIDTSGSMDQPNKLPLLKQSFRLMLGQLGENDSVSIVTYAGSAGRVLDPTPATERQTILDALENLKAGGGTAGQDGLQQAYATAREMTEDGEVSRVILATDGDFNIGISDPDALKDYIETERESGTYLSVLGFGRGNLDDATMQALAQTGNGMAAYIDTLSEAQKVLVDQLTGALVPIADDVKIQVEFNPATVAEYRLIGFETRALNREDFNNDQVDAGEIGAGHQVTAIYEVTPVGSPARLTDPLRYGDAVVASDSDELGFLRLRYKTPGEDDSALIEAPILETTPLPDADFAVAIAGFGQLLRGSDFLGDWGYAEAISLAQSARGDDAFGYRQEALNLMRLAQSLSQ